MAKWKNKAPYGQSGFQKAVFGLKRFFAGKPAQQHTAAPGPLRRRMPGAQQAAAEARPAKKGTGQFKIPEKRGKKRMVLRLALVLLAVFTVAFLVLAGKVLYAARNDYLWLDLEQIPYRVQTVLYYTDAETGEEFEYARLQNTQDKEYVDGSQMPQYLKDAFVAVEDKDFYKHGGISLGRTLFAVLNEIKFKVTGSYIGGEDGLKQGASTIDQQLIKNLTRDDQNSGTEGYMRKIREIYRAVKMDATYDKDTILSAYLNTISFTGNTAGVQAEAKKLFGKEVQDLTLAECASLASITRSPARYNPVTNPEAHLERRNYVLKCMWEQGYIEEAQYQEAVNTPLALTGQGTTAREQVINSYFTDMVIGEVVAALQQEKGITRAEATDLLYNGGLRISTTVAPELQQSMEQVMENPTLYPLPARTVYKALTDEEGNPVLDENGDRAYGNVTVYPQAAMVSLNYAGGIAAVVGGLGEKTINRGFNFATSAVRQIGSTMKPIGPYALALEKNTITWSSAFLDAPVMQLENEATGTEADWPANATNTYQNRDILVKDAFARSVNTVAVRVGQTVGTRAIFRFVSNTLGITTFTEEDNNLGPMVLGSSTHGVTPLELAKAYAMFGNGGKVNDTYCFTRVTAGTGRVYLRPKTKTVQAISEDTAYIVNRLMREVMVGSGTASGMSVRGEMDSVGKTGTTSDHRDHWFVGLTPYYVTASWYGYEDNLPLGVNSHWNPPILAWRAVMEKAQKNLEVAEFPQSEGVVEAKYCTQTGYAAGPNCPSATGYYKVGHLPEEGCPVHGG
ncbi:MAG: transglycosylase domain-containing protein [Oscillospiraceae bacterium]